MFKFLVLFSLIWSGVAAASYSQEKIEEIAVQLYAQKLGEEGDLILSLQSSDHEGYIIATALLEVVKGYENLGSPVSPEAKAIWNQLPPRFMSRFVVKYRNIRATYVPYTGPSREELEKEGMKKIRNEAILGVAKAVVSFFASDISPL